MVNSAYAWLSMVISDYYSCYAWSSVVIHGAITAWFTWLSVVIWMIISGYMHGYQWICMVIYGHQGLCTVGSF